MLRGGMRRNLSGYLGAALLLALFAWMADNSTVDKSAIFDEVPHLVGGVSHWRTGDTRLNPEKLVRRVPTSLGKILGLTPKSMR